MELQTIGQVSKKYGISVQTLRYYEQVGLIRSIRNDENAYRFYDEAVINQLHSIIILRKLKISVKQIKEIFNNRNASAIVDILERNIRELDEEITSLSTIKSILTQFAEELRSKADVILQLDLLADTAALSIADSISFSKNYISNIKEKLTMEDLNRADNTLSKMEDKDVRIVYLPPMTVAAAYFSGEAEYGVGVEATGMIEQFVWRTGLLKIKPDARGMGFNCSRKDLKNEIGVTPTAYEAWVSIPDDMEVGAPLIKKTFGGGLYAAHVLRDWSFQDWRLLAEWGNANEKYEADDGRPCFEEALNYYNSMQEGAKMEDAQLDLLLPIKKRENQ